MLTWPLAWPKTLLNMTNFNHQLTQPAPTYAYCQNWDAIVARQQKIYEELMANHELTTQRRPAGPKPSRRTPSVRELTRDLAGWTPQQAADLSVAKPHSRQS